METTFKLSMAANFSHASKTGWIFIRLQFITKVYVNLKQKIRPLSLLSSLNYKELNGELFCDVHYAQEGKQFPVKSVGTLASLLNQSQFMIAKKTNCRHFFVKVNPLDSSTFPSQIGVNAANRHRFIIVISQTCDGCRLSGAVGINSSTLALSFGPECACQSQVMNCSAALHLCNVCRSIPFQCQLNS